MRKIVREIHRRSLWQILGIYLAASWVALQVVETLTENLSLPDWVGPFAIVLLILGLPVVLATAFLQEGMGGAGPDPAPAPGRSPDPGATSPPASGQELSGHVLDTPREAGGDGGAKELGTRHRLFTWRNALMGGGVAFLLLALLLGGWLLSRALGIGPAATLVAKGVLDEQATIVLADFDSDDENLSRTATEAFRIDLSQSRVVHLADPAYVREALTRMQRADAPRLTLDIARELAQREGLPAVLHGEILAAGGRYVVSAALVSAEGGAVMVSHRETAADSSEIVDAIDATSNRLRERIGESLPDLRASAPLARVTTSDFEALRQYSQGATLADRGEEERAIPFLEQAIQRDSTFAMAYRKLGVILRNRSEQRARSSAVLGKAFAYRDRLTDRERYLTEAQYYMDVRNDLTRAAVAYESLLDLDPDDDWALNNAGTIYGNMQRDYERAEPMFRRAIEIDSLSSPPYFNLAVVQAAQWKLDELDSTLAVWERRLPTGPGPAGFRAARAFQAGAWDTGETRAREYLERFGGNPALAADAHDFLSDLMATRGRLDEARRLRREAEADEVQRGLGGEALGDAIALAGLDLVARDTAAARRAVRAALERYPLEDIEPLDRPYIGLVFLMTESGDAARARRHLTEWESVEEDLDARPVYWGVRGALEAAEGDLENAVTHLHRSDTGPCTPCAPIGLALAYDRGGLPDSAIVYYERFLDAGMLFRAFVDASDRGPALERLGQLYDERGDLENAAKYYAMFVELWEEADEVLQPRVRAAQARLEEIVRERG